MLGSDAPNLDIRHQSALSTLPFYAGSPIPQLYPQPLCNKCSNVGTQKVSSVQRLRRTSARLWFDLNLRGGSALPRMQDTTSGPPCSARLRVSVQRLANCATQ